MSHFEISNDPDAYTEDLFNTLSTAWHYHIQNGFTSLLSRFLLHISSGNFCLTFLIEMNLNLYLQSREKESSPSFSSYIYQDLNNNCMVLPNFYKQTDNLK